MDNIGLIISGIWLLLTVVIYYVLKGLKYGATFLEEARAYPDKDFSGNKLFNTGLFVVLLALIYVIIGSINTVNGKTGKAWIELLVPVGIIGTVAIGLTMVLINTLPLLMRAFENTIGYSMITTTNKLNDTLKNIVDTTKVNAVDYTILATQLYVENFKAYLGSMLPSAGNASISRFTNIFIKNDDSVFKDGSLVFGSDEEPSPVAKLLDEIIHKRVISETTWISLGTLLTMLGSYLYTC